MVGCPIPTKQSDPVLIFSKTAQDGFTQDTTNNRWTKDFTLTASEKSSMLNAKALRVVTVSYITYNSGNSYPDRRVSGAVEFFNIQNAKSQVENGLYLRGITTEAQIVNIYLQTSPWGADNTAISVFVNSTQSFSPKLDIYVYKLA